MEAQAGIGTRGKLRLWPLVAAIFFCVSGGPFGLEPVMQSGPRIALLLILITPIIWSAPAALMTAELAGAMPGEGGYYVWVKRALGPFAGFLCGWWSWVYSWVDVALYPALFATYVSSLIRQLGGHSALDDNPWAKFGAGLMLIVPFTYLNIRGIRPVGDVVARFMAVLLIPFVIMVALGLANALGHLPAASTPPGKTPSQAIGAGLFVVMWNYLAWDSMSTTAGEVENPRRNFPLALALGVPLVTLGYLLPSFVGISYLRDPSQWVTGAWTAVGRAVAGPWLAGAIAIAGILSICGQFSATLLSASRVPLVLAEDRYLPKALTRIHPRFGTPATAILVSAAVYTVLSYQQFTFLTSIDVVMYTAGLLLELLALIVLRKKEPEMPRTYRIPGGWPALAIIGLLPTALIVFAAISQYRSPDGGGPAFVGLSAAGLLSGVIVYAVTRGLGRHWTHC